MGQYWKAICLDTREWVYSHDYDNGMKLMEHSYLDNSYVGAVMRLMIPGGPWHKRRVIWAGDYSENRFSDYGKDVIEKLADELISSAENVYSSVEESRLIPAPIQDQEKWIIVNHTRKEYIILNLVPRGDMMVHPLPLMIADGNGRGGGDYHGTSIDLVGSWCGDVISLETKEPGKGFEELRPDFEEGGN